MLILSCRSNTHDAPLVTVWSSYIQLLGRRPASSLNQFYQSNDAALELSITLVSYFHRQINPESKVYGANIGPIWGRQNFACWEV